MLSIHILLYIYTHKHTCIYKTIEEIVWFQEEVGNTWEEYEKGKGRDKMMWF